MGGYVDPLAEMGAENNKSTQRFSAKNHYFNIIFCLTSVAGEHLFYGVTLCRAVARQLLAGAACCNRTLVLN